MECLCIPLGVSSPKLHLIRVYYSFALEVKLGFIIFIERVYLLVPEEEWLPAIAANHIEEGTPVFA